MTTLLSAVDEIEGRKQLTDEEYAALKERVKEQGAIVKASKEARRDLDRSPSVVS